MPASHTIANYIVRQWLSLLKLRAVDVDEVLAKSGLSYSQLNNIDGRIGLAQHFHFMQVATQISGEPNLALQVGALARPENMGVLGRVLMHSNTLADAGLQLQRYSKLVSESFCIRIQQGSSHVSLQLQKQLLQYDSVAATEEMLAAFVAAMRALTQQEIAIEALHFQHAKPSHHDLCVDFFQCPIVYQQEVDQLLLEPKLMQLAIVNPDSYVLDLAQQKAEVLLADIQRNGSLQKSVSELLLKNLSTAKIEIDDVAKQLAMSRWTLTRKLKLEGLTFKRLLKNLRYDLAKTYLASNIPIYEVAFLLGYSEPSAFNHAFKQWAGVGPREFKSTL